MSVLVDVKISGVQELLTVSHHGRKRIRKSLKCLHTDNGGDFREFGDYCSKHGI